MTLHSLVEIGASILLFEVSVPARLLAERLQPTTSAYAQILKNMPGQGQWQLSVNAGL